MDKSSIRFQPHNILYPDRWSAAVYVRLSNEDRNKREKGDLSQSIKNQTDFLITYLEEMNREEAEPFPVKLYKIYQDDDFTGMNFNRKGFQTMMADIKASHVDCIIIKNLSRLGRDDTEMQKYLEREFEKDGKEVRVVAVGDHYDSLYMGLDILTKVVLLLNREYSEVQHKNVSVAMHTMQKKGMYVGAFAPYGYLKDPQDKHRLIVDPVASEIVKCIYARYLSGFSPKEIARILTEEDKVVNPSVYKANHGSNFQCGNKISSQEVHWTGSTVKRILMNETYTGTLVQHKQEKKKLIDARPSLLPKEEWVRCPGTHEAIVSKEWWDAVQGMMKTVIRDRTKEDERTIFKGLLICGDCRHAMRKKWDKYEKENGTISKYVYYNCSTFRDYGVSKKSPDSHMPKCTSHYISDKLLRKIILDDLNKIISQLENLEKIVKKQEREDHSSIKRIEQGIETNRRVRNTLETRKKTARNKWLDGKVEDKEYEEIKQECDTQIEALEAENRILVESMKKVSSVSILENKWMKLLLEKGRIEVLDRETVVELVERIYVYQNHTIEIIYYFSDELDSFFYIDFEGSR